jgi:transposase
MSSKDSAEIALRKRAIRLTIQGKRPSKIAKTVQRSRQWLYKWQERFAQKGWKGLASLPRRPGRLARAYDQRTRRVVLNLRRKCDRHSVGLITARYLRQQLIKERLLDAVPSISTINRWLCEAGLITQKATRQPEAYFPAIRIGQSLILHLMDWTERFVTGGEKVFAFHTLDKRTRRLSQSLLANKSGESAIRHALCSWQELGLPDLLQIDNDSAFCGGSRTPRRFSAFVRLCLHFGIEIIFIPPAEARRNGLIEAVNHLWARSFWQRNHFSSLTEAKRKKRKFLLWYLSSYSPPELAGKTPGQVPATAGRTRLTESQVKALPEQLPVTCGRIHFIRKVNEEGRITLLGERWRVGKRLRDKYVWATVNTATQRLDIYCRASLRSKARKIKQYRYEIKERVVRLQPLNRPQRKRVNVRQLL